MATGDNVLTAISVARHCHIIDENKEVWLADSNDFIIDSPPKLE